MSRVVSSGSAALIIAFALLAPACGPPPEPRLSEITLSRDVVRRGIEVFATAVAEHPHGDLHDALILVDVESRGGDTDLFTEVRVTDVPRGAVRADVTVGLVFLGDMELGRYDLAMRLEDEEGRTSEPSKTRFVLEL